MATVPAVLDSVPCQVTFARSSSSAGEGCTPCRKEERSTVEASRQAISMLLAARRQNGSNRRR